VPYRFPTLARLVGRLVAQLGYETVDVLGLSWGGGLAQQFALTQRGKCRRLILVSTATGALMVPASPRVLVKMATPRRYRDTDYLAHVAPHIYGGTVRTHPERVTSLLERYRRGGEPLGYAYQLLAGLGWTSVAFLPLLSQPTLVLAGDDDPIVPSVNGRILAWLIPKSQLHIYHGGHVELVANPELLAPVIERFLM
jgi:poly(3-hydroxyalkanoate) depolymerase